MHRIAIAAVTAAVLGLAAPAVPANAATTPTLTIFAAGTLAVPFRAIDKVFEKENPGVKVQAQFGGSVKMAKKLTELHQRADIYAAADYSVMPKYLFARDGHKGYTTWYIGFARNAITFVYTDKSKYAKDINTGDWYRILARPGVEIGRSDPNTDPSGYQTVQMLELASKYYRVPKLASKILANAPRRNMRDTETSLLAALQVGQIDYLAIYRSDALQHHLHYLKLPAKINLSDPAHAAFYKTGAAHTKNGDLSGKPIVYAITIPNVATHTTLAQKYLQLVLGPEGRRILAAKGFGTFSPAYAAGVNNVPAALKPLVKPWPSS